MPDQARAPASQVPVIDLSASQGNDEQRLALAQSLRDICHQVGFFVIENHGIEPSIVDQAFGYSKRFFALPLEQKLLIDKRKSPYFRGWEAEGAESTNNRADIREQIDLWTDHQPVKTPGQPHYLNLLGPNQWPPEDILPGFRLSIQQYIDAMNRLGDQLMSLLALGLDLPADFFDKRFGRDRMSLTKLIRYPPTPAGEFGVNAHQDTGFLTILNPGETPGLEIKMPDGSWLPVPIIDNSFVINLGEMLQAMSGNYFVATPHRVAASRQRFSIGYFHGPALDTSISRIPLADEFVAAVAASPRHSDAGFMAPIKATQAGVQDMQGELQASTFGDQLWNYFCRSYPDNAKRFYPDQVD